MNKKIIALALAIVFVATAFVACQRGPELTKINGMELPLETDKDGQTIINDENQVAVIVTDRDNEVITDLEGENQTHWVQINGPLVIEDTVQTKDYSLAIPSGWVGDELSGRVIKKNTDDKCYIQFVELSKLKDNETLIEYIAGTDAQDEAIADTFEDDAKMSELIKQNPSYEMFSGCKYTLEKSEGTIEGTLSSQIRTHKIVDKNGEVIHYVRAYYFVSSKTVYKLSYACEGGEGYNDSFNFEQYISDGFTFKGTK